jgi:hypothetical protein
LRAARPDSEHLDLGTDELGRPDDDITTVLDVEAHFDLRRAAMALHASQGSPYDGMPDDLVEAFLRHDRFVRVAPPWSGDAREAALHVPDRSAPGTSARSARVD